MQRIDPCQKDCTNKKCFLSQTIETVKNFRIQFWGTRPRASSRREKIQKALHDASVAFQTRLALKQIDAAKYRRPFVFLVNDEEMCEKSYVNLLGMADNNGYKLKTWNNEVDIFLGEYYSVTSSQAMTV